MKIIDFKYIVLLMVPFLSLGLKGQVLKKDAKQENISQAKGLDPKIKSLRIGDKVPDILISKIVNSKNTTSRISDFKDKLLILDFWATSCGSCIEALPKMDSLQRKFAERIKILPVSYEPTLRLNEFFKKNPTGKNLKLPSVAEDKFLASHFKHKIISHVVWIYKGVVSAITTTEYVKGENIERLLKEGRLDLPVKDDLFGFNAKKPIFSNLLDTSGNEKIRIHNYSAILGHVNGIDYKGGIAYDADTSKHIYRTYFFNQSIPKAYQMLLFSLDKKDFVITPGRLILNVSNPEKYIYKKDYGYFDSWQWANEISYEMVTSKPLEKKKRIKMVLEDLNVKLGLTAGFEKRKVKCLVLVKQAGITQIDTAGLQKKGTKIAVSSIPLFLIELAQINNPDLNYPPAVDETNEKGSIYIDDYQGLEGLRAELHKWGYDLIETEREIEVLVINEKG